MLVIPVIHIDKGAVSTEQDESTSCVFQDPIKMARLWRVQNAKSLHVEFESDELGDREIGTVREVCAAVDVPIQVRVPSGSEDRIASILDGGAYRILLGFGADLDYVSRCLEKWTASRICIHVRSLENRVAEAGAALGSRLQELERHGVTRSAVTCVDSTGRFGPDEMNIVADAAAPLQRMRLTLAGGITGYEDLRLLQEQRPERLDSVLIRRALYENRFPCQRFWCWHFKEDVDLGHFSSARLIAEAPGDERTGSTDHGDLAFSGE